MAALIIIDVQKGFEDPVWGARNNRDAEARIASMLAAWRRDQNPVFHVKHNSRSHASPLHVDSPGNAFKPETAPLPGEPVIEKDVNSAFIGTGLEAQLRNAGIEDLVLVGLTTPHCVSTTARMASNLDFRVRVVSDATAAFAWRAHDGALVAPEDVHYHALAALHGEFCTVVTAASLRT